ncbi:MAG TPA: aminotransferase class IV, partial [Rubricoccaceae bacterium]
MTARLLETMRAEGGHVPLLDRHLARLGTSAAAFGYGFDAVAVARAVAAAVPPTGVHRVRLTLGPGPPAAPDVDVRASALDGSAFATVWL